MGETEPPLTVISELWMGIPPMELPETRLFVRELYMLFAELELLSLLVLKVPAVMTEPCWMLVMVIWLMLLAPII